MSIDLHCHTKISDGSMGIEDLIATAKRRGLKAIAVTDHDAVVGATRAAVVGKRQGFQVIPGAEFSTIDTARGGRAHILAYLCDTPDRLEGMCRRIGTSRRTAATEMLRKVLRYYPIVPESVARCAAGSTNIFKQHIMHALMDAGYTDTVYGDVYQKLFNRESGCAYVPVEYPDTQEVIDLIHSAGGIAVLAHPAAYHNEALMEELTQEGLLDGVEVYHPDHTPEDAQELADYAAAHGLAITGGSDFHGMYSPFPRPLGYGNVPDELLAGLAACKTRRTRV